MPSRSASAGNPPKRVAWGEQSTDEMGSVGIQVVAANERELPILQRAYTQHVREAAQERMRGGPGG